MKTSRSFTFTAYTLLTVLAFFQLFPVALLLIMSFKSQSQLIENPLLPSFPLQFENYTKAWNSINIYLVNTFIIAGANLIGGLTVAAVAAYVFARYKFPGKGFLFALVLALIMIPDISSLIPRFILIRDLNLLNTLWAVILPGIFGSHAFSIVVLRTFFENMPEDLFEAARIDGAGHLPILTRLVVPLSWPVISSLAILSVLASWNDFIWPLIVLNRDNLRTISIGLYFLATDGTNQQIGVQMAGNVIAAIPLLILFLLAMRTFIEALRAALGAAKEQGGGVVFVPQGLYRISGRLDIPRHTVLRGVRREQVWLFVPKEVPEFDTVISGSGEFGVEELSLVSQTAHRLITAPHELEVMHMPLAPNGMLPQTRVSDIFLRRLRLQHLRYAHRIDDQHGDSRRQEMVGPATVSLVGPRLEISECEIVSSGNPIDIRETHHTSIRDNHFHTGRNGWYRISGVWETVFENNLIEGRDMEASYGSFSTYDKNREVSRLYIAHNHFRYGFGGEREAITFDSVSVYPWFGLISGASVSSVRVDGANWSQDEFVGLGVVVVGGTGVGQHRRITSNSANQIRLSSPWDILPGEKSIIAVITNRRDNIVYHNRSEDTSVGVQLWGGGYNFIIDGNISERTGGFWGTGVQYYKEGGLLFLGCFFNQWLDNEIRDGFIYQQGPDDIRAALGVFSRQVVPQPEPAATVVRAAIIRNNRVFDGAYIAAGFYGQSCLDNILNTGKPLPVATGEDIVIEENSITDAPVGVRIGPYFEQVLIRNNTFNRVAVTVEDSSRKALVTSQAQD